MLYSDEQIEDFADSFIQDLSNGVIKKKDVPNEETLYHKSIEKEDMEWVLSANPQSKLFRVLPKTD